MMQDKAPRPALRRARNLRQNQTDAEKKIWGCLRAGRFSGFKFRRQFPIGPYIADFVCPSLKLVIEIDGGQHNENPKDAERTAFLSGLHYQVLRFWNNDVMNNTEGVLETILAALDTRKRILAA